MNEARTRAEHIDPALKAAGWGIDIGEASWVLEDNEMSNRTIQNVLRPEHYKTYRIYEKPVVKGLPHSGVRP